jgi:hypothetical protein
MTNDLFASPDITLSPSGHPVYRDPGRWIEHPVPPEPVTATPEELEDKPDPAEASNVVDGTAHSCRIMPDPGEPDLCSGCGNEWPCEGAQRLRVAEMPSLDVDPTEQARMMVAVRAARAALDLPPEQNARTNQ